jgi:hypothetical protein
MDRPPNRAPGPAPHGPPDRRHGAGPLPVAAAPEAALAALERSFDGPVPPGLREAAACGGAAAADRRAAAAEARLYERQAGEARLAAARLRQRTPAGLAPEADPELSRVAAALTRSRFLGVARLSAARRRD